MPFAIVPVVSAIGWFWTRPAVAGSTESPPPPVTCSPGRQNARATDVPGAVPPKRVTIFVTPPDVPGGPAGPASPFGPAGPVSPLGPTGPGTPVSPFGPTTFHEIALSFLLHPVLPS